MFQDLTSLVLDIGTYKSKIGYGGDDAPKLITNSYVSRNNQMDIEGQSKYLIGDKYLNTERENKQIQSIFKRKDADACEIDFEKYQAYVQSMLNDQLQVDTSSYSILLSEDVSFKPHQMKKNRQKIAEFMFEKLNVPNVYFLKNPVLSCFSTGRSTALVCDSGDSYTKVVAVHDGYCLYKSAKSIAYAGASLSQSIKKHLQNQLGTNIPLRYNSQTLTSSFRQYQTQQLLRDIKQSFSNRQNEQGIQQINSIQYQLPDNKMITINKSDIHENFLSCIQPHNIKGYLYKGIPQLITQNINYCDIDIKKQLYSNILLTGGNMLYSNIMNQILNRISQIAPPNAKVKGVAMVAPQERIYSAWIGGSIVTSLSSFQSYWVGKQQWKQNVVNIIQKKCN